MRIAFSLLILFLVCFCFLTCKEKKIDDQPSASKLVKGESTSIHKSVIAGKWYPKDKSELTNMLTGFLSEAEKKKYKNIKAIIVPHAGYAYSGSVAASAYKQLEDIYKKVIIIGPSHYYPLNGLASYSSKYWETPLGKITISDDTKKLFNNSQINEISEIVKNEHCIDIELPFLQTVLKNFSIVPIVLGEIDHLTFAKKLNDILDDDTLLIVSADLSHYHQYDEAKKLDAFTIKCIQSFDTEGIYKAEIDAPWAVSTLLSIAKENNWKVDLVKYANSGDITGDKSKVVGYCSFVIYDDNNPGSSKAKKKRTSVDSVEEVSEKEQQYLLKLARNTIKMFLKDGKKMILSNEKLSERLYETQGCFVTLHKDKELRGCVGHIIPKEPLYQCIIDNAINASTKDYRFSPLTLNELSSCELEISVLSVPVKLEFSDYSDLLSKIEPNKHGVILKYNNRSSTFLPQVWEQIPDKEEFFSSLCLKQDSPSNCWKDKDVEVEVYSAIVFKE